MRRFRHSLIFVCLPWLPVLALADTFTIREDDGNTVVIEARLAGQRQGHVALERADGRFEIVPQQQILKREVGSDPTPVSCKTVIERLTEQFGAEKFRGYADSPFVIGLILSEPLPKKYERNVNICLKKGAEFMKSVERVFLDFTKELKIETEKPRFPLVVLIFETDDDFVRFSSEETGGQGLPPESMLGYYSGLTNRLVLRMSECYTFTTPLHEAIHQQVYNRGLIQRLSSSVPAWFNEGIATSFEGNNEKIKNGPQKINSRYARRAMQAKSVDWDDVVADDKAFHGDILAGEAYATAWGIHWFLVTKYRKEYIKYLQLLGEKLPLQVDDADTRTKDFEQAFGKSIRQLQSEFPAWLEQAARKQGVSIDEQAPVGHLTIQSNLAEVEMTAIESNGTLVAEGRMKNISRIRPMSFHITVETDAGTYAEWYLHNVNPSKVFELPRESAKKQMKGGPERVPKTFRVKVKSVVADSDMDLDWQRGQLPVPVWSSH